VVRQNPLAKIGAIGGLALMLIPGEVKAFIVGVNIPGHDSPSFTSYLEYIRAIFKFALQAGIALTTLMIIYAGIRYMSSQGNQSALNDAKDITIGALSGLAMLALVALLCSVLGLPVL
jgi:hypothetical protein